MCGLAGFLSSIPVSDAHIVLRRMTDVIRHRGPDDHGFFLHDNRVALGHRRLSIVDLSGGHQPMTNEDGSVVIVFNGEIFNHAEVRPELERRGHRYQSHSDTETIIHAWEEWGPKCLERFRGMFAFVLWDGKRRKLYAVRDRLGIKPFYYFFDGRTFVFGSEIKAVLGHPAVSTAPDETLFAEYLAFGYQSGPETLFRNIRKLMPGHWMEVTSGDGVVDLKTEQYWDVPETGGRETRPDAEWIERTRAGLEETVRLRLMADVPLGTFLSGGLDSSVVTALVKGMVDTPVKTFSVGYEEEKYSELAYASRVAQILGTSHHEVRVSRSDFFSELPRLIWHEDEPITWPSSVSLYFVSKLAAQEVKVVLTGEGSDELFAGYERYRWNLWNSRALGVYGYVPGPLRRLIRDQIASSNLLNSNIRRKLRHTFLGRDGTMESLFLDNFYGAFPLDEQKKLLPATDGSLYASYMAYWNARPGTPALSRMLYADQKTYLVELLMKQDQMSMATSIESRVPFLDHHFVSFCMSMPDHMKIRGAEQKYVLKKVAEALLPHDIVYRKKMGFPTPLRDWLREAATEPLRRLVSKDSFLAEYINVDEVRQLLGRHQAGLEDGTDRIWRLLNLEIWGNLFFRGDSEQAVMAFARQSV
jgi:asparagine synthase (glutamine-hydrolysing)